MCGAPLVRAANETDKWEVQFHRSCRIREVQEQQNIRHYSGLLDTAVLPIVMIDHMQTIVVVKSQSSLLNVK